MFTFAVAVATAGSGGAKAQLALVPVSHPHAHWDDRSVCLELSVGPCARTQGHSWIDVSGFRGSCQDGDRPASRPPWTSRSHRSAGDRLLPLSTTATDTRESFAMVKTRKGDADCHDLASRRSDCTTSAAQTPGSKPSLHYIRAALVLTRKCIRIPISDDAPIRA